MKCGVCDREYEKPYARLFTRTFDGRILDERLVCSEECMAKWVAGASKAQPVAVGVHWEGCRCKACKKMRAKNPGRG